MRSAPRTRLAAVLVQVLALSLATSDPARAQLTVFDPANHVENALQTAHQLQSLTNEAQMLINQARELAASPYSHLLETSQALKDIGDLAASVRGIAADIARLETQFEDLYPSAVEGLDPRTALSQASARATTARASALDLASTAAQLEQLSQGRGARLQGALSASQAAAGQASQSHGRCGKHRPQALVSRAARCWPTA